MLHSYPYLVRRLVHSWPFRGRRFIVKCSGLSIADLPEGDIVSVKDGRRFYIHKDLMYLTLFTEGSYNRPETDFFERVCRKGDVVFDIGANFGWYTTLFSLITGPSGQLHAFEPSPPIFQELECNIKLNSSFSSNVRLNNKALGQSEGNLPFYAFKNLPHGHSSLSKLGRADVIEYSVPVSTIDKYIQQTGLNNVDLIKMDIEGSELMALHGATDCLSRNHPIWLIEMNDQTSAAFGYKPPDLLRTLSNIGKYDLFFTVNNKRLNQIRMPECYDNGQIVLCAYSPKHIGRIESLFQSFKQPIRID